MKLKTYEAPTLHAALRLARIELGSEAVLLEAKEREAETAQARFQVTFALGAEANRLAEKQPSRLEMPHWKTFLTETQAPAQTAEPEPQSEADANTEPEPAPKPRRRTARKKPAAPKPKAAKRSPQPKPLRQAVELPDSLSALRTPQLAAIFGHLAAAGVTSSEAMRLAARAAERAGCDDDASALEAALRETLDGGWRIHSAPEPEAGATRILALAGPAGVGKSTTAVKAAMLLIRAYDRPAAIVSLGRHPVGGVELLEAWTTLLDLRLEIVESPAGLPAVLEHLTAGPVPPGAIVIDLPAGYTADVGPAETHLVLPATYSAADLARTLERYSALQPVAAVFTRLDEAAAPGVLWNFQRTAQIPASYLGCGPDTPGDLSPATPRRLTQRLLGR